MPNTPTKDRKVNVRNPQFLQSNNSDTGFLRYLKEYLKDNERRCITAKGINPQTGKVEVRRLLLANECHIPNDTVKKRWARWEAEKNAELGTTPKAESTDNRVEKKKDDSMEQTPPNTPPRQNNSKRCPEISKKESTSTHKVLKVIKKEEDNPRRKIMQNFVEEATEKTVFDVLDTPQKTTSSNTSIPGTQARTFYKAQPKEQRPNFNHTHFKAQPKNQGLDVNNTNIVMEDNSNKNTSTM